MQLHAPSQPIRLARSLQDEATLAERRRVPMVVVISQTGCPFCRALREKVLLPMLRRNDADQRFHLFEVSIDEGVDVVDFDGATVSGRAFADRYKVQVTPTVLVLDAAGNEMGAPLRGTPNLELYSFYLNQRIDDALARLQTG